MFYLFNILLFICKNLRSYLKKNYPRYTILICCLSVFLLVIVSPVFSLLWLCVPTLYFLYTRQYRSILKIWFYTLSIWYFIFTTSLAEITIVVGFENTRTLTNYLLTNHFLFENLCFQTVYLLDSLSNKLGFSIYIPSIINVFSFLKNFKITKTGCAPAEQSSEPPKKSQGGRDMSTCARMAESFAEHARWYELHHTNTTTENGRTVIYSQTKVPFFGTYNACFSKPATELEKKQSTEDKTKK